MDRPAAASVASTPADPTPDFVQHFDRMRRAAPLQTDFGKTPPPPADPFGDWFRHLFGQCIEAVGRLLAPLAPALPYLLTGLVIAAIIAILSPVAQAWVRRTARGLGLFSHDLDSEHWRPTRGAAAALIEAIDRLAEQGRFEEAVHHLLQRTIADLDAYRPDLVRPSLTARDLVAHPSLSPTARPAFSEIARWSETAFFAGRTVGEEGFRACRAAYIRFVEAEARP